MKLLPIVMIKNEEIWIERVLQPLIEVFGEVIVGDTGSTDSTLSLLRGKPGVDLIEYPNLSMADVGRCRQWLQEKAETHGATHTLMVDGDELYPVRSLFQIAEHMLPSDKLGGFTAGIVVTSIFNQDTQEEEFWELDTLGSRMSVWKTDTKWSGVYPYENPSVFKPAQSSRFYYYPFYPGEYYHYVHLHQLKRSSKDHDVHFRTDKQFLYSMQPHPDIKPVRRWYPD